MGYYDPPEQDEFLGCPCCGASEDEVDETEDGKLICSVCHTDVNWAYDNQNLWSALPEYYYDRECCQCKQTFAWESLTRLEGIYGEIRIVCPAHRAEVEAQIQKMADDEQKAIQEAKEVEPEHEQQVYIDRGWIDANGELTDAFFRESQMAYERSRGK